MVPTLTSNGLYGCCISVECSEVTVSSSGSGVQAGLCQTGFPQNFLNFFHFLFATKS